ncbi:metal-dependent transcriptional regulator [Marispirochaeta sp.]|uniref:metal-dependent transcriptional regulator n=1 Tax=Marispirochaeta sp. TaxID=2038653 RepID=UPI0029C9A312|nr:metal-dependent transcriptional regulator [Marispirochaeta sp.]
MDFAVLSETSMKRTGDLALQELHKRFPAALDYLTTIFLIDRDYGKVANSRLAARLGVSKPAVSQAVGRLKRHHLADQDSYGTIRLTPEGRIYATRILKRHYLIEHLLIRRLDYPWDKADEEALRLQAAISEEFAVHLFETFGRPDTCPHGNPFPGNPREKELLNAPPISDASAGSGIILLRITEEGEAVEGLLQFCNTNQLRPGREMEVIVNDGENLVVGCCDGKTFTIPKEFARHLRYRDSGAESP